MKTENPIQRIPIELATYIFHERLVKPFQIYMYFKCCTNGKFKRNSQAFRQMSKILGIKSHNTINKYLKKLIYHDWIGCDTRTQTYFIRSINFLRNKYSFYDGLSVKFYFTDIKIIEIFLASIIVCNKIQKQINYFEMGSKKKLAAAVKISGTALQAAGSSFENRSWLPRRIINEKMSNKTKNQENKKPDYYGYSSKTLAIILKRSRTTSIELKLKMKKWNFIKTIPHFKIFAVLAKRDKLIRNNIYMGYPELNGKLIYRVAFSKNKKVIELVQQLHDEIIPNIKFIRV